MSHDMLLSYTNHCGWMKMFSFGLELYRNAGLEDGKDNHLLSLPTTWEYIAAIEDAFPLVCEKRVILPHLRKIPDILKCHSCREPSFECLSNVVVSTWNACLGFYRSPPSAAHRTVPHNPAAIRILILIGLAILEPTRDLRRPVYAVQLVGHVLYGLEIGFECRVVGFEWIKRWLWERHARLDKPKSFEVNTACMEEEEVVLACTIRATSYGRTMASGVMDGGRFSALNMLEAVLEARYNED
ncbi:hypothetical protein CPB85DRAFT_1251123 [Mucidula mucida]|nr:hypothetical protein CPB85DRAFT_1251123 [Mucidula mucida]